LRTVACICFLSREHSSFDYVEGPKHITGDSRWEFVGEPWYFWISNIARSLFAPKRYVLSLAAPLSWDNQGGSIPQEEAGVILDRIERALQRRYKGYAVEFKER
jgi:hypothetical protein